MSVEIMKSRVVSRTVLDLKILERLPHLHSIYNHGLIHLVFRTRKRKKSKVIVSVFNRLIFCKTYTFKSDFLVFKLYSVSLGKKGDFLLLTRISYH